MTTERHQKLREYATALGDLLVEKQTQYGDSVGLSGEILRQLYPTGIRPDQYDNLQLVVRVLDKLKRIASQGPDATDRGGESPWRDVAGYGILGLAQAEARGQSRIRDLVHVTIVRTDESLSPEEIERRVHDAVAFSSDDWGMPEYLASRPATSVELERAQLYQEWLRSSSMDIPVCDVCAITIPQHIARNGGLVCPPSIVAFAAPGSSCHGCKHVHTVANDGEASYCNKTNRPHVTARVEPDGSRPTWCPGREEQAQSLDYVQPPADIVKKVSDALAGLEAAYHALCNEVAKDIVAAGRSPRFPDYMERVRAAVARSGPLWELDLRETLALLAGLSPSIATVVADVREVLGLNLPRIEVVR